MKLVVIMGEPKLKVATTDLYSKGKKVKTENGFIIDHTQPRSTDYLRVHKGAEYYEWTNENGEVIAMEEKWKHDQLMNDDY
jgi:hypothetical protein